MDLLQRTWCVRIGTEGEQALEFSELAVEFHIEKSLRPEPNKCKLVVYNLSPEHRSAVEAQNLYDPKRVKGQKRTGQPRRAANAPKPGKVRVEIEAGYLTTGRSLIFRGDLRRALSNVDGATAQTHIEGEDGGHSILASRVSQSFPAGTPKLAVVKACASAMGLGLGNLQAVAAKLSAPLRAGTAITGQASAELSGVLRAARISYSVQNGVLQFHDADAGLQTSGFVISSSTGMVGEPQRDSAGQLVVTTLILPSIAPGAYVQLQARNTQGVFKIVKVTYTGQSHGDEWYARLELVPG